MGAHAFVHLFKMWRGHGAGMTQLDKLLWNSRRVLAALGQGIPAWLHLYK